MLNILYLFIILFVLAGWYGMIYDAYKNQPADMKWKWIFFLVVANVFAALIYYLTEYRPRNKKRSNA